MFHRVCEIVVALDKEMLEEVRDNPVYMDTNENLAYAKGIHEAFKRLARRFSEDIDSGGL